MEFSTKKQQQSMANFLSEAAQFNNPQAPYDLNLINSTLALNQAKYDQGEKEYENNLAQLKVQENLLRRDKDKERFAQNVQGLINEINGKEGGINWAKRGLTNKINAYTNKALDSYTLDQIGISQTIRAFDTEVAKKKEKNDGSYNDTNYAHAQYKANLGDYLNGKDAQGNRVDKIGNLSYKNYVNDAKHFTDDLDKYVKEYAVEHNYTSTGKPGDLIFRDETHEIVTKDKIINRMKANLTPEVRDQLEINGWGVARSNPEQNKIDFSNYNNKNASDTESDIITLKAKLATATKEEKLKINNDISIKEKEVVQYKEKAKNGTPTDNDNTQMYTSNLFNLISSGYVKDDIVDRDINDSNLQIAKYESDEAYKKEDLKLKKESNKIAKEANDIATGIDVDDKDVIGETKKPTDEVDEIAVQKKSELKNVFLANDAEFRKLPADKQWEYIEARLKNDKPVDITTDESSQKVQEAMRNFKSFNDQYSGNRSQAFNEIYQGLYKQYNKLRGSKDVYGGNFAESNPNLVNALKAGKDISKMDKEERLIILHEMATNQLQTENMDEDQRELLKKATINIEKQKDLSETNKKTLGFKSKEKVSIYNTGLGDLAWGTIKGFGEAASTIAGTGINWMLGRDNTKNIENYKKSSTMSDAMSEYAQNNYFNGDLNPFQGNTNIGEIQNRNITSKKQDGRDLSEDFAGFTTKASNDYTAKSTKLIPKIYDSRALAFSDDSKYGKVIKTAIAGDSGEAVVIEDGSAIKASMIPGSNNIEITYIPKKEDKDDPNLPAVKKIISASSLPDLAKKLYTDIVPMEYSRKNLDAPNKRMVVSTPKETKDVFGFIKNLHNTYGEDLIPVGAINGIVTDSSIMSQAQFESVAENKTLEVSNKIKEISSSIYGVEWENIGGVWTGTAKRQDGRELIINTKKITTQLDGDYNEGMARLLAAKLISDAKTTQISELIK